MKHYYIIKVKLRMGKTYFKIGESDTVKRPESLKQNYLINGRGVDTVDILTFEELKQLKGKRVNDKQIHKNLDPTKVKKVNLKDIKLYLDVEDGKDEFFEVIDPSLDLVSYVHDVQQKLIPTVKVKKELKLEYDPSKKHLVSWGLINYLNTNYPMYNILYSREIPKKILLIGQFEQNFIRTFAMFQDVYIWHDSKDQVFTGYNEWVDSRLTYFTGSAEEFIEEYENMKFDLIIANPPYGSIGANITKYIIDNIKFDEYINLLPANDYKRNKTKDLFNYQTNMSPINNGFDDAAVTTSVAKMSKVKINNLTEDEFKRSQYIDRQLDKYFEENSKRKHYAIDVATELQNIKDPDLSKIIFIGSRDINHKHLPYTKNTLTNSVNLNLMSYRNLCDQFCMKSAKEKGEIYFQGNCFVLNTPREKSNCTALMYSDLGFRFFSKLFTSMNVDGRTPLYKVFPKVDWTRSWTVEELLEDYGYTADEVKEVIDDLVNYKGMKD